jgi:MFS family permease
LTASLPSAPAARSIRSRIGIPELAGNRNFVTATGIDSIGTGLILAFTVIYFVRTTSIPLPVIGLAITLARLLALPTSVTVGPLMDRFTARRTAVAGNLVSAAGYTGFLAARASWSIIIVVFLVQVGHTTYWTSSGALIGLASPPEQRPRWFAFIHAVRNSGLGIGSALGAFALVLGGAIGLHAIVIANAASFALATALLASWRPRHHDQPAAASADSPRDEPGAAVELDPTGASYRRVLRNWRYTVLISVNVTLVFSQMLISILLAIYIVEALHVGAWIAGMLIMMNTIQVALLQTVISSRMERYRTTRAIIAASLLNVLAFGLFALLCAVPGWAIIAGLFVAMIIFSFGEIIAFPAIDYLSVSMAEERIRGRYLAVFQLSWTVGQVTAPGLLIFLLARGAVLPMIFLLALSLLAVPLLLLLERMMATLSQPTPAKPDLIQQV